MMQRLAACEEEVSTTVQSLKIFAAGVVEERALVTQALYDLQQDHDRLVEQHEMEVSTLNNRVKALEDWLLESHAAQQLQQQGGQEDGDRHEQHAQELHELREQAEAEAISARQRQVQQRIEAEAEAVTQQERRRYTQAEAQATSPVHAQAHACAVSVAQADGEERADAEETADAMIEVALESPEAAGALGLVPPAIAAAFGRFDLNGDGVLECARLSPCMLPVLVHQACLAWCPLAASKAPRPALTGSARAVLPPLRSYSELREALHAYGLDVDSEMAAQVLHEYDEYPDGTLDVFEFSRLAKDLSVIVRQREAHDMELAMLREALQEKLREAFTAEGLHASLEGGQHAPPVPLPSPPPPKHHADVTQASHVRPRASTATSAQRAPPSGVSVSSAVAEPPAHRDCSLQSKATLDGLDAIDVQLRKLQARHQELEARVQTSPQASLPASTEAHQRHLEVLQSDEYF